MLTTTTWTCGTRGKMVRKKQFTTRTGKDGSAHYFTEHLSASDYYQSRGGILQGKTFEHMGMSKREVDLKVFSALESNLHPETGERITLRTNSTRREWWIRDCHKISVSIFLQNVYSGAN